MDLKSMGRDSRNRAGERELLQMPFMANPGRRRRGERDVNGSEAGGELGRKSVDDLATSLAGKTRRPSTTAIARSGGASGREGAGRWPCLALCRTGKGDDKDGRVDDEWAMANGVLTSN